MSLLVVILLIVLIYLAIKVAGFMFKLGLIALVIVGVYWLAAPYLGQPLPF